MYRKKIIKLMELFFLSIASKVKSSCNIKIFKKQTVLKLNEKMKYNIGYAGFLMKFKVFS